MDVLVKTGKTNTMTNTWGKNTFQCKTWREEGREMMRKKLLQEKKEKNIPVVFARRKADAVEKGGKFVEIRQLCLTAPPLP